MGRPFCIFPHLLSFYVHLHKYVSYLMKRILIALLCLFCLFSFIGQAQARFSKELNKVSFDCLLAYSNGLFMKIESDSSKSLLHNMLFHQEVSKDINRLKIYLQLGQIANLERNSPDLQKYQKLSEELFSRLPSSNQTPILLSEVLLLKGTYYNLIGEHKKFFLYTTESLRALESLSGQGDTLLLRGLLNLSIVYIYEEDFEKAEDVLKRTNKINLHRKNQLDIYTINYYRNSAIVADQTGNIQKAKAFWFKAYTLGSSIYPKNSKHIASLCSGIGSFLIYVQEYDKAIEFLEKVESVFKSNLPELQLELATTYVNYGNLYNISGDIYRSLEYYSQAEQLLLDSTPAYQRVRTVLMNNMGSIYSDHGDYSTSIECFQKCLNGNPDASTKSKALRQMGANYSNMGMMKEAINYLELAISHSEKNLGKDHYDTYHCYLYKANFLLEEDKEEGIPELMKAFHGFNKYYGGKNSAAANCMTDLGNFYSRRKEHRKALECYQLALINTVDEFNDPNWFHNPSTDNTIFDYNLLVNFNNKADEILSYVIEGKGDKALLQMGLSTIESAILLIEQIRSGYSEQSKYTLMEEFSRTFNVGIRLSYELYQTTGDEGYIHKAFSISGRGRSAIFQSSLQASNALQFANIPSSYTEFERKLREEIPLYEKRIYEESPYEDSREKVKQWQAHLFYLKSQYAQLIAFLEKTYPAYYELKHKRVFVGIPDVQKKTPVKSGIS